jgi:acetyl-CoA synthetase
MPAYRFKRREQKMELVPPQVKSFINKAEEDYEGFWEDAALKASDDIHWFDKWDKVFEWEYPTFKWYKGGITNVSYNCVDYKVRQGKGSKAALIYECGDTGEIRTVTYIQLLDLVKKHASALRAIGVQKGDRVALYLPMNVEAVVAMLACARIGAIHVAIYAGFSAGAIADRLDMSGAKYILTQDKSSRRGEAVPLKDMVDDAIRLLPSEKQIRTVVVLRRSECEDIPMQGGRDISWNEFLDKGKGVSSEYVPVESNEPLFLMPTSGTTARPKVTVHNHGGYQVHIYCQGKWIYGLKADDIWFSTSDIGWIVGHSYNVYGPLLFGCTSILYEGTPDYPRKDMWWDLIERNMVTGAWFSPTGIRGLMRLGIEHADKHDLTSVQRVVCAGEVLNPAACDWLQKKAFKDGIPVIDHMWQTETGGPIVGNTYGLGLTPIKPGSASLPVPGVLVDIVDENDGHPLAGGEKGALVIRKPFPGLTPTLWGEPERYRKDYWEATLGTRGSYYAGDAAYKDGDGYIWFTGRADEVIKIAAHRVGTIEIENVLVSHPAVIEAGVSGVPDELRGEVASAFVVLAKGYKPSEELKKELIAHIRKTMGPIVVMKDIQFINTLPKTRSGKIMRRVMKSLMIGKELGDLSTIKEEACVDEIREAVERMKSGR